MRTALTGAVVAALAVGVSGLALAKDSPSGSQGAASGAAVKAMKVDIQNFKYKPQTVEIKAGTKVSFTNGDTAKHTATSQPQGKFDSGDISKGQTKKVTFKTPGTFRYYCVYHAFMTGSVKVDP